MDALPLFADGVYRQVVEFAAAVTALGLVVMAIIQSAKDLLPVQAVVPRRVRAGVARAQGWGSRGCAEEVARQLGAAPPRSIAARAIPARALAWRAHGAPTASASG